MQLRTVGLQRTCNCDMCQHGTIGDEEHPVSECLALQDLHDKRPHLFEGQGLHGAQADPQVWYQ